MNKGTSLQFGRRPRHRQLVIDRLEARRLLTAEVTPVAGSTDTPAAIELLAPCSAEQETTDASQSVGAQAGAGQHVSSANVTPQNQPTIVDWGTIEGTAQARGALNWFDRIDLIRFEVPQQSKVRVQLDQLSGDAALAVFDARGRRLGRSDHPGQRSEALQGRLPAGDYYVAVTSKRAGSVRYRLLLDVRREQTDGETERSTDERQASPSPPPPVNVPLPEVADYGRGHDWNLNQIAAPEAWAAGYAGRGVTVAVIDTGVDLDHPELADRLFVNPGEIPGNGLDDDRNGYVDDVSGYDFVSGDPLPEDGHGHGTHVAGTIAAARDGRGTTGVAPEAQVMPIRVLDDSGSGSDGSVAAGIRYAAELGAEIINLSLGGDSSKRIRQAVDYASSLGSLVIAAAGNQAGSRPSAPARYSAWSSGVLSVGAHDASGRRARFSNVVGNSGALQVDAPGVAIVSTMVGGGYATLSGTSMASPHVAGLAALILSANPNLMSSEVRQLIAAGVVGQASGSDALGQANARYSVAYAAAGRMPASRQATPQNASSATANGTPTRIAQQAPALPAGSPDSLLSAAAAQRLAKLESAGPGVLERVGDGALTHGRSAPTKPAASDTGGRKARGENPGLALSWGDREAKRRDDWFAALAEGASENRSLTSWRYGPDGHDSIG